MTNYQHTNHAQLRAAQRGIKLSTTELAIQYGQKVFKQGLVFYVITERCLPAHLKKEAAKLVDTVVVTALDANTIITVYRGNNPLKRIKHKPKGLVKY